MEISEIRIRNIKRFGDNENPIKVNIKSGMVNLLIAPNGWGKSSITTAFDSLKENRIEVSKENSYHQDEYALKELRIIIDGNEYVATQEKNTISKFINCKIIHCDIFPKTITRDEDFYTSRTKKSIGIKEIPIMPVYKEPELSYRLTRSKESFGENSKVLNNLGPLIKEKSFLRRINERVIYAQKELQKTNLFDSLKTRINQSPEKTAQLIKDSFVDSDFKIIEQNRFYKCLRNDLFNNDTLFDAFTNIFQLVKYVDFAEVNQFKDFYEKEDFINEFKTNIKDVAHLWRSYDISKKKDMWVINFPDSDVISNGERDILTFSVRLQLYKQTLRHGENYLLFVDEIFDYLDGANMLAAQYYLSEFIRFAEKLSVNLFICVFTHLPKEYFNCNLLQEKLNCQYLSKSLRISNIPLKNLIAYRENLYETEDKYSLPENDQVLYQKLSIHLFHYHPDNPDFEENLKVICNEENGIKPCWANGTSFFKMLLNELNKYLSGETGYDPYSVCIAIRLCCEKKVYKLIENVDEKEKFLKTHGTTLKMRYAEKKRIIPDAYYILSIIHGESDHIKYDEDKMEFSIERAIYALDNLVIKHMIAELFDYQEGETVLLDKIH